MKKTFFIALLLLPFISFSQTTKPIDGFLGIKFGSSKVIVLAALRAKGAIYDKANSTTDQFAFRNVKLGHRESIILYVGFVNGKAFEADYFFGTDVEAKIPGYYHDLTNDVNAIYGTGKSAKIFTYPYQEGDGNELLGLSAGKIDYHTTWRDNDANYIEANISTDMKVILTYQDNTLGDQYRAQQKSKESKDF